MTARKTNTEFMVELMTFSANGALIQCFVMTALQRYAEAVQRQPIPDDGMIDPAAWTRCADEVLERLEEHYK